ncbi:MAG: hypothetical protein ABSF67_22485 [Roseiarcus sp.]|jgi:hypothetical protein
MADPQIVTTLRRKRDEIESAIVTYRAKIQDAERDGAGLRHMPISGHTHVSEADAPARRIEIFAGAGRRGA